MTQVSPDSAERPRSNGAFDHLIYVLKANPVTLLAFVMFALIVISALFGPALVPYDPLQSDAANALQAPS
ncbi:MAG: ABC transporter permease, partial [Pseudomonadota bacterium]|nr:ABC transporter permease [Pseudomonadota bacterium]